ncbi:MAG: PIN domain-containing protein [Akkermansiaceae bacterium]|nr:PIN domain-containing protein [Akkermansiaceae bacterium]MCF7731574.1 PIN domain-containing protein [Akkermansiaceae bacterium]
MTASSFFDTNIFLYVVSAAPEDAPKRAKAIDLIGSCDFAISVQVMQEFADAALRKKRLGVTPQEVRVMLEELAQNYPVLAPTPGLVFRAFDFSEQFKIRFYDAAILAAAQELGCQTLYTEDLSHGQTYGSVRVINPFL